MNYIVHGILPDRIVKHIDFSLLQGIIPSQGLNPGLPYCRWIIYQLSYQGCTHYLICLPCQLQLVMQLLWSLMIRVHFCPSGHGTTDWFQIGKGVHQGCILSPCLFNLYAEYIRGNAGLDEAQAEIKITGRNINSHRNADDTTLKAESEERTEEPLDESERGERKS